MGCQTWGTMPLGQPTPALGLRQGREVGAQPQRLRECQLSVQEKPPTSNFPSALGTPHQAPGLPGGQGPLGLEEDPQGGLVMGQWGGAGQGVGVVQAEAESQGGRGGRGQGWEDAWLLTAHLLSTCCVPPVPRASRLEVVRPRDVAQRHPPPPLSPGLVGRQLSREKRPLPAATAGLQIKGGREPSLPPRPLGAPKDSARHPASHSHHPAEHLPPSHSHTLQPRGAVHPVWGRGSWTRWTQDSGFPGTPGRPSGPSFPKASSRAPSAPTPGAHARRALPRPACLSPESRPGLRGQDLSGGWAGGPEGRAAARQGGGPAWPLSLAPGGRHPPHGGTPRGRGVGLWDVVSPAPRLPGDVAPRGVGWGRQGQKGEEGNRGMLCRAGAGRVEGVWTRLEMLSQGESGRGGWAPRGADRVGRLLCEGRRLA